MAWRIGDYLERAEIDNRVRGRVEGYVLLRGCEQPILLNLEGNCWRDMAGQRFVFEGTGSGVCSADDAPAPCQEGVVGDMTASRKVRAFAIPLEEALARIRRGETPPEEMANGLYLEWYSDFNGRVVLETTDFRIAEMSDVAWKMTDEDEREQRESNLEAMGDFMNRVELAAEMSSSGWTPEDDEPMDEFQWERFLRESDRRSEKYGEELGLMEEDGRACVREMTFQSRMIGTKLAGALNSLGYRGRPDPGFIVAYLKRALGYFDPAMKALNEVQAEDLVPASELASYKQELFEIREAILNLMRRFRGC